MCFLKLISSPNKQRIRTTLELPHLLHGACSNCTGPGDFRGRSHCEFRVNHHSPEEPEDDEPLSDFAAGLESDFDSLFAELLELVELG